MPLSLTINQCTTCPIIRYEQGWYPNQQLHWKVVRPIYHRRGRAIGSRRIRHLLIVVYSSAGRVGEVTCMPQYRATVSLAGRYHIQQALLDVVRYGSVNHVCVLVTSVSV